MTDKEKIIRIKQLEIIQRNTIIEVIKGLRAGLSRDEMNKLYARRRRATYALKVLKLCETENTTD